MGVKNCGKHRKHYDDIENNLRHHCLKYQLCSNKGAPTEQEDLLNFRPTKTGSYAGFIVIEDLFHAWRLI